MSWTPSQSVNFFREEFKQARLPRPVRKLLWRLSMSAALLIGITATALIWQFWLQQRVASYQQQSESLERALQEQTRRLTPQPVDPRVQQGLDSATDALKLSRQRLAYLQKISLSNRSSYLDLTTQLGRAAGSGIWLNRIRFDQGDQQVRLQGIARTAADVPAYLHQLTDLSAYQGRTFEQLALHIEDGKGIGFVLDSVAADRLANRSRAIQGGPANAYEK